jgi:hypothetical protein
MSAIVAFIVVHVTLALLVPQSLLAMLTGGPVIDNDEAPNAAAATVARSLRKSRHRTDGARR